jgi:hypothetical protein
MESVSFKSLAIYVLGGVALAVAIFVVAQIWTSKQQAKPPRLNTGPGVTTSGPR